MPRRRDFLWWKHDGDERLFMIFTLRIATFRTTFSTGESAMYRVGHLKSWVHHSQNFIAVTGLQTDNVIDDIVHLIKKRKK